MREEGKQWLAFRGLIDERLGSSQGGSRLLKEGKDEVSCLSRVQSAVGAVKLFTAFALYLLAECPEGEFASGHTFRTGNKAPRYRVEWEPCIGYDEDDFFFNPFGRWRFIPCENKP